MENSETGYCNRPPFNTACAASFGTLDPTAFTYNGASYAVTYISTSRMDISPRLPQGTAFSLYVGDTAYATTYTETGDIGNYILAGGIPIASGQSYTVSIRTTPPETPPETTLWTTTMTVGVGSGYTGYSGVAGSVASNQFMFNGSTYRVVVLAYGGASDRLELVLLKGGSRSSLGAGMFKLTLGSQSFSFDGSTDYSSTLRGYPFTGHGLSWSGGQSVTVSLVDFTPTRPGTLWRGSLTAGTGVYNSAAGVGYCGDLPPVSRGASGRWPSQRNSPITPSRTPSVHS